MGPEQTPQPEEKKSGFSLANKMREWLGAANAPNAEKLQQVREAREADRQDARVERTEQLRSEASSNLVVDADTLEHPIVSRQEETQEAPQDLDKAA